MGARQGLACRGENGLLVGGIVASNGSVACCHAIELIQQFDARLAPRAVDRARTNNITGAAALFRELRTSPVTYCP